MTELLMTKDELLLNIIMALNSNNNTISTPAMKVFEYALYNILGIPIAEEVLNYVDTANGIFYIGDDEASELYNKYGFITCQ